MRIVWQTVRRITKETLRVKVLIGPFLIDRWQDNTSFIWLSVYFFRNECHVVNGTFNINHRGFKMKSKQSLISYQWHRGFCSNPFTFDEQGLNCLLQWRPKLFKTSVKSWLWECARGYQLAFFLSDDASYVFSYMNYTVNNIREKNYAFLIGWKRVHFLRHAST